MGIPKRDCSYLLFSVLVLFDECEHGLPPDAPAVADAEGGQLIFMQQPQDSAAADLQNVLTVFYGQDVGICIEFYLPVCIMVLLYAKQLIRQQGETFIRMRLYHAVP